MEMHEFRKTFKSAIGTSFHDVTVTTTYNTLVQILGDPNHGKSGDGKTNYEWVVTDKNGNVCTIYDWKEYRDIDFDENITWHIGGKNSAIENKLAEYIEEQIELM